jgi:predicted DNA-binding transcriptional regulator AlpA
MRESKAKQHDEFISVLEAEKRYPMKKDWYYRHMDKGTLPFRWYPLIEGKRFVKAADIEAYIGLREVPAGKLP